MILLQETWLDKSTEEKTIPNYILNSRRDRADGRLHGLPDALSSISVARAGEGDMAVANVLGSNIFNILLGLALPWFIKALIDGEPFALSEDEPILSSVLVLIAFLAYFLWLVARAGWKHNREIGWLLLAGQLAFIVYSTLTFYVIEVPF